MFRISFKFFCLFFAFVLIQNIFSQSSSGSWNSASFSFDSGILNNRFDRADREITPQRWIEEARRGIESARILWEEMIPELYRDNALMESLSAEFYEWSERELENRFTQWLLKRFFGAGSEILIIETLKERERADLLYLYKTDEEGNILFDENTGDPLIIRPTDDSYNFERDLFQWRKQIESSSQNEIQKYELHLTEFFPELLVYIDESRRGDFGKKLTDLSKTAVQSIQHELADLIAREQRLFTARRLGDVYSLRKKSEDGAASSIGSSLIEEALRVTNEGIAILEAKIEAAEAGNGDLALAGTEWLAQYREQFERGLRAWEEAEERFFIRRLEWEQNAIFYYNEAENAWNNAFIQFDEARHEWEYKAKNLFTSGELLFKDASAILEKTILEAKAEFAKDSRVRTESAVEKARAWADMYITASSVVSEAQNNLKFWQDRLSKESNSNTSNINIIMNEIENWTFLYNSYYAKALEAKSFLENEFSMVMGSGLLYDVLTQGVSSEDFFLDGYQAELLRSQAVAGYWNKRVVIAQAVLNYAEDLTSGRITESEGIVAWEKAKAEYDNALYYYQSCMDSLKILGADSLQIQERMREATYKIQMAEATLEELNRSYTGLIAVINIYKENYYLDEIDIRSVELMKISNILDDTGPDSIMMRYLEKVYQIGSINEAGYKMELLKELVIGGLYFDKSLAELSMIANNIKVFSTNDILPNNADEFGISKDNVFYKVIEKLLDEKEYILSTTDDEEKKLHIGQKYDTMIKALSFSAKNFAIREEQNRILALEYIISPEIESFSETKLYADLENASLNLLKAQIELELQAIRHYLYGELAGENAILLSGFCFFDESEAEKALETILIIIEQNKNVSEINSELNKAALKNEYVDYFMSLGSFFISSNFISLTDFFLDSYIAEIETIEGMITAYKFAELINPVITNSIKDQKLQILFKNYNELGIYHRGLLPKDINSFIDKLILNSNDPIFSAAQFLFLIDDVLICLPEWINYEAMTWIESFIEMFSFKISGITTINNETELLDKLMQIEKDYLFLINHDNYQIDKSLILKLERELFILNYELTIINKIKNTDFNPKNNEMLQNLIIRKTALINSAYEKCCEDDIFFTAYFYNTVKNYISAPFSEWIENYYINDLFIYLNELEILANEFNYYEYIENTLFNEIDGLKKNFELLIREDGSFELEIERISDEIEVQKKNIEILTDEFFKTAENFSIYAKNYDIQYAEIKRAYSLTEETRFNYEIQDAIKRWASTAYLGIQDTLHDLHESQEKLKRAELVLEFLKELYKIDIQDRPFVNEEYNTSYMEYFQSYSDLHVSIKAVELLNKTLYEEMQNNKNLYEEYQRQLKQLGGDLYSDYFNQENILVQTLIKFIKIENDRLVFEKNPNNSIPLQVEIELENMNNFFSFPDLSEYDTQTASGFELALIDLNKRLKSYNFNFDKYVQWGMARDYLLAQILINFDEKTIILFGIENLPLNSENNKNAWNGLSEQEKLDLEFFAILSLFKSNNDYFNRMSEYVSLTQSYEDAKIEFERLSKKANIPVIGLFWTNAFKKAQRIYLDLWISYVYFTNSVTESYRNFNSNSNLLELNFEKFNESSELLLSLYGGGKECGLSWNDINDALVKLGFSDTEIKKIESFWLEASVNNDLTSLNIPQALDFILEIRKMIVKERESQFENIWNKISNEYLFVEAEYLRQYDFYLSGNISIDEIKISALNAFGNQNVSIKTHLNNIEQLSLINMELFSGNEAGFKRVHNELLYNYVQLINRATVDRYDAELQAREAEWDIQRNDLEEKYLSWLDASVKIFEKGNEDWKNNSIKLADAYSLWLRTFENEYYQTSEAWTSAYLEGLKDKEIWVEKATRAAEDMSSYAMLILLGNDGESMARAMDTRDPIYIKDYDGSLKAQKTLDDLIASAGIYKLDEIFSSLNSIAGTINTTLRGGLRIGNTHNYGLIQVEASRLAKTAKDDVSAREIVRIAVNLRDIADQAIKAFSENVDRANMNIRKQMDDLFIIKGSWRRYGLDYHKDVLVHSTFFNSIITDSAFVQGYRDFVLESVHINTDLSEDRIKYLDSIAVQFLMESIMLEISEMSNQIFGLGVSDGNSLSTGEFNIHVGNGPDINEKPNIDEGRPGIFNHYGDGELGILLTEYYYWYFLEQRGLALLAMPAWDKPLWDSRGSWFNAPSLRSTVSIGVQVIAAIATGGTAMPLVSTLLNIGTDLIFGIADVAGGYKSWSEAGVEFGKSVLTNAISYKAGTLANGLTNNLTNLASSGAITQFTADIGNVFITGVKDITVGTINSAISAISYSDSKGWGWSSESFSAGVISSLKGSLISATGALTSSILNIDLEGSDKEYKSNANKLHNLLGGLVGQGVNYAMGGDFTLNLFNLDIFNTSKTNYNMGLLELHFGRNGVGMQLGTGGVDTSFMSLSSAIKGLEMWKVNLRLYASDTEASRLYKSQLRTLYCGNEILRKQYEDVLAGETVYRENRDEIHTRSEYDESTGIKTVYLGSQALEDGSRFGLNVYFAHEAYRNGIIESDEIQEIKTRNAVYGHNQTALDLVNTYGILSLDFIMGAEAIIYDKYLKTGNNEYMEGILGFYDSTDEFWKLVNNKYDKWGWDNDKSPDFDIRDLINTLSLECDTAVRYQLHLLSTLSELEDGKEKGIISAERMTPYVAALLGNAIISQSMQNGVFEYRSLDSLSIEARNSLIADTMSKMSINAMNMTGVYNQIIPMILGKGSGDNEYDYLVPIISESGSVFYSPMDRESFLNYYDRILVEAAMKQLGKNYVWGGKDPEKDGGLDCSGYIRWAQIQVYGQAIAIRNAHDQRMHPNLTIEGNEGYGSLNYYTDDNGNKYHHVTIYLGNGYELNPYGGEKNDINNPGRIRFMELPQLKSHQTVDNRRTNWHYLFFTGNNGQLTNYF
ncbi:MAG: C40 family peptidase [Treponema sp.]|jgi:hypothetical protein|nr:C40 family peptidase [Treponema sp.]